jgi:hypothetical protein
MFDEEIIFEKLTLDEENKVRAGWGPNGLGCVIDDPPTVQGLPHCQ